jgi:hypothetical protein
MPLTHELDRSFRLGALAEAPLSALAASWIANGCGEALAELCERTFDQLARAPARPTFYWYEEVAMRSRPRRRSLQLPTAVAAR